MNGLVDNDMILLWVPTHATPHHEELRMNGDDKHTLQIIKRILF